MAGFNQKGVEIRVRADTTQAKKQLSGLEQSIVNIEKRCVTLLS